jgi:hypothetical protein
MSSEARCFARRVSIFCAPLLAIVVLPFVVFDPFKIIYRYSDFNPTFYDGYAVYGNSDYFGTETYLRSRSSRHWRSLLFGNSRSAVYRLADWAAYVDDPQPFYFGAAGESLFGIASKMALIDRLGDRMENALLVLDRGELSETKNRQEYLFIKHPAVSRESSLAFYSLFVRTYLSDLFYLKYLGLRVLGPRALGNEEWLFTRSKIAMNPTNFEWTFETFEEALAHDEHGYYAVRAKEFYPRNGMRREAPCVIGEDQEKLLADIRNVLTKHQTKYKVIISPLYDQEVFNRSDLRRLVELFGEANVFDFSGVNPLTTPVTNFYDSSHYRPTVARAVLSAVYRVDRKPRAEPRTVSTSHRSDRPSDSSPTE